MLEHQTAIEEERKNITDDRERYPWAGSYMTSWAILRVFDIY